MTSPRVAALLDAWEFAARIPAAERPAALVDRLSGLDVSTTAARLPIGERDRRLFVIRRSVFGSRLPALLTCPACAGPLELCLDVDDLLMPAPAAPLARYDIVVDGWSVGFRLPDTVDIAAAARSGDIVRAREELRRRCLVAVLRDGAEYPLAEVPELVMGAVARRIADLDPQVDVQLAVSCPTCPHEWVTAFDIGAYMWLELDSWARRVLAEVHTLAGAYGWSERDILSLSPARRRLYIGMIAS